MNRYRASATEPAIPPSRRWNDRRRWIARLVGIAAVLAVLHPAVVRAEAEQEPALPRPLALAGLSLPVLLTMPDAPAGSLPAAVLVIHDRLGPDGRGEPYIAQLVGAGIAVFELMADAPDVATLDTIGAALAGSARIDPRRLGVLAFGAGGWAAAGTAVPFRARVLLYPGCATLLDALQGEAGGHWPGREILIAHGTADAANEAPVCEAASNLMRRRGAGARRIEYPLASYAWDRPVFGMDGRSLLPNPNGQGRVLSEPWPDLAAMSAAQVAAFFAAALRVLPP